MVNNRTLSIWNDLRPYAVGFDSLFDQGDTVQEESDGEFTSEQAEAAEDFLEHL